MNTIPSTGSFLERALALAAKKMEAYRKYIASSVYYETTLEEHSKKLFGKTYNELDCYEFAIVNDDAFEVRRALDQARSEWETINNQRIS